MYQDTFWRSWSRTACNTFLHLEFIEHLYMFMNFNPSIFELKFVKVGDCFWKYCFYLDRWLRYLSQNRPDKKCKHGLFISTSITCYWIKGKSVFFVFWASWKVISVRKIKSLYICARGSTMHDMFGYINHERKAIILVRIWSGFYSPLLFMYVDCNVEMKWNLTN